MFPGYMGLTVAMLVWTVPESPRWLIAKYGREAGRPALEKVRDGDVTDELKYIEKCLRYERQAGEVSWADLFTKPGLRYRLFVASYLPAAQQFTGVNAFLIFQDEIFKAAGIHTADNLWLASFFLQLSAIPGVLLGIYLIDSPYGGRRMQLLAASFLMGPLLILGALCNYFDWSGQLQVACVFVFFFGFQMGWGPVPWFYPGELFKTSERERALSISTASNFTFNLLIGFAFPVMQKQLGPGTTQLIFGLLNITNMIFVSICVKETKGVALDDIPFLFDGIPAGDMAQAFSESELTRGAEDDPSAPVPDR